MDIAALPPPIGLPTQFSSSTPVLQAGQIVDALVLALLENDTVRLSLPGMVLDVRSNVALTPGMTVRLAVQSTSAGLELVIIGDAARGAGASSAAAGRLQPVTDQTSPGQTSQGAIVSSGHADGEAAAATSGQATIVEIGGTRAASLATGAPEIAAAAAKQLSPAEVVGQAARIAASRQGGLAPLLANVAQVVDAPAATMPRPVLQAALGLLGFRVPLDEHLSAGDLRQALVQSGLFLEAQLAAPPSRANDGAARSSGPGATGLGSSGAAGSGPAIPNAIATSPAGDLKAALLVFREVVKVWLDTAGPPNAGVVNAAGRPGLSPAAALPPPYRGAPPSAQPVAAASIPDDAAPADVAQRLLGQTDAALARHTLMQIASLPEQAHAAGPRTETQGPQWLFEIPFTTRQGTSVAQFEIARDGHAVGADGQVVWRAKFSLDVEPMGPVHAQVSVVGARAAVTLWAERDASVARLRESTATLSEGLRAAELEPGDIQCRAGAPVAPRPAAGRFLDQAS